MLFSELDEASRQDHMVHQLVSLKRCFGSGGTLGIVRPGGGTDRFSTVSQLVAAGHARVGLEWLDEFLPAIPPVSDMPDDDFIVDPHGFVRLASDGSVAGPPCPWQVAREEQTAAASRAAARRAKAREQAEKRAATVEEVGHRVMGALNPADIVDASRSWTSSAAEAIGRAVATLYGGLPAGMEGNYDGR